MLPGTFWRPWWIPATPDRVDTTDMSATSAELASMATTLEDLVARLSPIADSYEQARREDLVAEVREAERVLDTGVRRLRRLAESSGA